MLQESKLGSDIKKESLAFEDFPKSATSVLTKNMNKITEFRDSFNIFSKDEGKLFFCFKIKVTII